MAFGDEQAMAARYAARDAAAARYVAHLEAQRAAVWRVALVEGRWRVAVQRPGGRWETVPADLAHFDDVGDLAERARLVAWLREDVLEVRGIVLYTDYAATAAGRVAYEVGVTR